MVAACGGGLGGSPISALSARAQRRSESAAASRRLPRILACAWLLLACRERPATLATFIGVRALPRPVSCSHQEVRHARKKHEHLCSQRRLRTSASAETGASEGAATATAGTADSSGGGVAKAKDAVAVATTVGIAAATKKSNQQNAIQALTAGLVGACLFCGYVYATMGFVPATQWLSCYVIEYSLSIDNLFVFILIFKYFKIPPESQRNVLNYGIAGAIIFRFVFIYLGAMILQEFEFLILGFAAVLIYASYSGFTKGDDEDDEDDENLDSNVIVTSLRKVMNVSPRLDGERFFTEAEGMATPLLLCLLTIEFSDIVFATDSVPAVLGTTKDQFIAYSSNLFAVFGLRSLYFLLQDAMVSFQYLESAVNVVLGFIGVKIVLDFFGVLQIDMILSLAIILGTLGLGVGMSISDMNKEEAETPPEKS